MKTKHAKEPWEVYYARTGIEITAPDGLVVVPPARGTVKREACFDRIVACVNALEGWADPSAAGDLLEAAKEAEGLLRSYRAGLNLQGPGWSGLRDAIAKAEGG